MSDISKAARDLLQELSVIPQVVGYDHRIAELDDAGLIIWKSGEGYFISEAGRKALVIPPAMSGGARE